MWDVNTCVMPTLVVCDMAKKLFCDGAGLEAEKLVCDSLVGGWWKAGNPGAVGLGIFGRAGNYWYGNALTRW